MTCATSRAAYSMPGLTCCSSAASRLQGSAQAWLKSATSRQHTQRSFALDGHQAVAWGYECKHMHADENWQMARARRHHRRGAQECTWQGFCVLCKGGRDPRACTISVAMMDLALMRPGMPRYWMPLGLKMVAPASNQGTWLVWSRSSGTTMPAHGRKPTPVNGSVFYRTLHAFAAAQAVRHPQCAMPPNEIPML